MNFMAVLFVSFAVIFAAVFAMSIGVLFGGREISGSCGGVGSGGCELCSGNCRKRND